jgi:hypothetical protein
MTIFRAVLAGFLVTTALILAGGWASSVIALPAMRGEYYTPTSTAAVLALVYTAAAITAGGYVAARIDYSDGTLGAFVVTQAFFGFGLIREFWSTGSSWYAVAAMLLVIPCAIVGRLLAWQTRPHGHAR